MSKYKLPNGLIVNLDDETGATTVVGGGKRTVAPGVRITDDNYLGAAPTGNEPRAISRPSDQMKPISDEAADHPDAPLAAQTPPPDSGLVKEDPIGDTLISAAVGGPVRDVAGAVLGKVVPKVAEAGGAVGRAIGKVVQPSVKHALGGAAEAGVPALLHTGDPLHAAKAAAGGAVVGGLVGQAAHGALKKIIKGALAEKAERAAGEAAEAATASHAVEAAMPGEVSEESFNAPPAPPAGAPAPTAPFASLSPTATQHLTVLAGDTGQQGVSALREVALRPSTNSLREAVRVGIPPHIALQVARLGAARVAQ